MDQQSSSPMSLIRRAWDFALRHWKITVPVAAALVAVVAWLIFGFFAVQTLFIDEEVEEALPTFGSPTEPAPAEAAPAPASPTPAAEAPAAAPPAGESPPPAPPADGETATEPAAPAAGEATEAPSPAPAAEEVAPPPASAPPAEVATEDFLVAGPGASGMPGDEITPERADAMNEAMAGGAMPLEVIMEEERPTPLAPQIVTLVSGGFISRSHHTEGRALVLNDGSEQRFLRFENFRTDNGPDVDVWLSDAPPDAPARDFLNDYVNLGDLKGNVGSQNYEIPVGVDLDHYSTVVVWCVRFSVAFGTAPLA